MKFCLGFILILFHLTSFGQTTIADFIRSAVEDPGVKTFEEQLAYLETKPYRLSPLQKLEFRTQNRELLSYQQEVALRFTPANPWELRNNNRYFMNYQSSLALEKEIALKESLVERYGVAISFLYYTELKALAEEGRKLTVDQLSILEKQSASSSFDADEYVKLRVNLLDRVVDIEEADFEVANQRNEMNRLFPEMFKMDLDWTAQEIITAGRIEQVIDSLVAGSAPSTDLAYQQQQVKLAESEYKLEKSNITLGFLQTEYDHRRVVQERTPVNISLGITLPITNQNKGDMTKRKLQSIEAENDLINARNAATTGKDFLLDRVRQSIHQYYALQERVDELADGNLAGSLSLIKRGDPLVILQFNESLVKLRTLQTKVKRNLLLAYIDFLAFNDKLQQMPLVNYLSGKLGVGAR